MTESDVIRDDPEVTNLMDLAGAMIALTAVVQGLLKRIEDLESLSPQLLPHECKPERVVDSDPGS